MPLRQQEMETMPTQYQYRIKKNQSRQATAALAAACRQESTLAARRRTRRGRPLPQCKPPLWYTAPPHTAAHISCMRPTDLYVSADGALPHTFIPGARVILSREFRRRLHGATRQRAPRHDSLHIAPRHSSAPPTPRTNPVVQQTRC